MMPLTVVLAGKLASVRTTKRLVTLASVMSLVVGSMVKSTSVSMRPNELELVTAMLRPVALGSLQL
jgi:hypothetical protein